MKNEKEFFLDIKRIQQGKNSCYKRYSIAATLGVLLVRLGTTSGVLVMLRGLALGTGFLLKIFGIAFLCLLLSAFL